MEGLNIVTVNVNGWRDERKRRSMFRHFHEKKFDIVCVQETHACSRVQKLWANEWGGRLILANGSTNSKGVGVLFRRKLKIRIHYIDKDINGRFIIIDLNINEYRYTLALIYAPNGDEPQFFVELFQRLDAFDNVNRIILGDFNVALDTEWDLDQSQNAKGLKKSSRINKRIS